MKKAVLLLSLLISIASCDRFPYGYKYETGSIPTTPVNLTEINTEYDDYNATSPILGETFPLCFSTNRKTQGGTFDIIYKLMSVEFSKDNGDLSVYENKNGNLDVVIENASTHNGLGKINTTADEFGPLLMPQGLNFESTNMNGRYETYLFLYASNENGNLDIKFTHNLSNENFTEPIAISFLNSAADDAYPTISADSSSIYFTSNRDGNFDIFQAQLPQAKDLLTAFSDTNPVAIAKDTVLSSTYDDKCPYITSDFMVFTSNRLGGYGGYDLYYSWYENGAWSAPQNFGEGINTAYDEYRPIARPQQWGLKNDFMLFSSNRPGGQGGFDLYYVGIDKIYTY